MMCRHARVPHSHFRRQGDKVRSLLNLLGVPVVHLLDRYVRIACASCSQCRNASPATRAGAVKRRPCAHGSTRRGTQTRALPPTPTVRCAVPSICVCVEDGDREIMCLFCLPVNMLQRFCLARPWLCANLLWPPERRAQRLFAPIASSKRWGFSVGNSVRSLDTVSSGCDVCCLQLVWRFCWGLTTRAGACTALAQSARWP